MVIQDLRQIVVAQHGKCPSSVIFVVIQNLHCSEAENPGVAGLLWGQRGGRHQKSAWHFQGFAAACEPRPADGITSSQMLVMGVNFKQKSSENKI